MNADKNFHPTAALLNEYLDSALPMEQRAAVEAHLAQCPACAAQAAGLRALFAEIESLPEVTLKRNLAEAVLAAVTPPVLKVPPALRWAVAAQAALAVGLMTLAAWTFPFTLPPIESVTVSAWPVIAALTESVHAQWQILIAALANGQATARALLPTTLEGLWGLGAAAVLALWLAGNGVLLRRFIEVRKTVHG